MAATNLRDERVDQMVVLEVPGELSPFVAALAGPTVDFVAEKIGEACIAAGPELLAHPQQQETAVAWAADLEPPEQLDEPKREQPPIEVADSVVQVGNGESERSEEHTSELQSPDHLVCRLLLEK